MIQDKVCVVRPRRAVAGAEMGVRTWEGLIGKANEYILQVTE